MKQSLIKAITGLVFLCFALTTGTVQICAQQLTPTPGVPVPTPVPTPTPDLERRVYQLEVAQNQTQIITAAVGGFLALLVTVQSVVQGFATVSQVRREGRRDDRQARREEEWGRADRADIAQVSNVMNVVQRTLESRLDAEKQARKEAKKAQDRLHRFEDQVKFLGQFYQNFQKTIKDSRQAIEDHAFQLAQTSRHDFRGKDKMDELNTFVRQLDTFRTGFETLEEKPCPQFSPRVPYIYGVAKLYVNQPEIAKQYIEEVVRSHQPESDEDNISYNRRVANTYYYLGLTESNFGNQQKAIALFEEANKRDLQDRDFLTRVVTAEAYVMINSFDQARRFIDHIEKRLGEIERIEGPLRNFQLRLRSRAALVEANIAILERNTNWHQEAQKLLEPVYETEPQYYYATATLAQVYCEQGDHDKAQELFSEAYRDIERSGHLGYLPQKLHQ